MTTTRAPHEVPHTPVQAEVLDLLGRRDGGPHVSRDEVAGLRAELDERVQAVVGDLVRPDNPLWIGKSTLQHLAACEGRWQAEETTPFRWSVQAARGTVAHKAIELQVNWRGDTDPGRVVDEAITRLIEHGNGVGRFLRTLSTVDLAELRQAAVAFVAAFEETFPPLRSQWRPVIEGALRLELAGGRVVLAGRPDLTLGRASSGGKVIVDLKTGARLDHHADDLRFYALIDACRIGVAPRRVATMYLDAGAPAVETITTTSLRAAVEQVVTATRAIVSIRSRTRPAVHTPSSSCRWCPAAGSCAKGQAWLRDDVDEGDGSFWLAPSPALFVLSAVDDTAA